MICTDQQNPAQQVKVRTHSECPPIRSWLLCLLILSGPVLVQGMQSEFNPLLGSHRDTDDRKVDDLKVTFITDNMAHLPELELEGRIEKLVASVPEDSKFVAFGFQEARLKRQYTSKGTKTSWWNFPKTCARYVRNCHKLVTDYSSFDRIKDALTEKLKVKDYTHVASKRLEASYGKEGIYLYVYAKDALTIDPATPTKLRLGGGNKHKWYGWLGVGYGGNKGGVFISFKCEEKTYTFVNCHLSSDSYEVRKRHFDDVHAEINMEFPSSDYTFLGGDFNIRKKSERGKIDSIRRMC